MHGSSSSLSPAFQEQGFGALGEQLLLWVIQGSSLAAGSWVTVPAQRSCGRFAKWLFCSARWSRNALADERYCSCGCKTKLNVTARNPSCKLLKT